MCCTTNLLFAKRKKIRILVQTSSDTIIGFKTYNWAQGQGGLKRPTAGISGIFRGLDVSVQHRDLSAFGGLSPRWGFETTSIHISVSDLHSAPFSDISLQHKIFLHGRISDQWQTIFN
jgi:hypothetical protein